MVGWLDQDDDPDGKRERALLGGLSDRGVEVVPRRQCGRGKVGDFFRQTGKKVASVYRKLFRSRPARQATKRTVGALLKLVLEL